MFSDVSPRQLLLLVFFSFFLHPSRTKVYNKDKSDLQVTNSACKKCLLEKKNDVTKIFIELDVEKNKKAQKKSGAKKYEKSTNRKRKP